jgi:hypothetical protein
LWHVDNHHIIYQTTEIIMWFDQEEESTGYTDMVSNVVFAALTIAIAALLAMGIWTLRTAGVV